MPNYPMIPLLRILWERKDKTQGGGETYEVIYLWMFNEGQFIKTKTGKKLNSHHLDYG